MPNPAISLLVLLLAVLVWIHLDLTERAARRSAACCCGATALG